MVEFPDLRSVIVRLLLLCMGYLCARARSGADYQQLRGYGRLRRVKRWRRIMELEGVTQPRRGRGVGVLSRRAGLPRGLDAGVMKMRAVENVALPPGKTVKLAPGGCVMLMDLKRPLKEGDKVPLRFPSGARVPPLR